MAEGKKTFVFYSDWINMVRELDDEDAGGLLKHILAYVNDENPTTDNKIVKVVFAHMKPILKKDLKKWEGIREIRKKIGKKGGEANAKQIEANAKQLEAVNVNVNVSSKKEDKSSSNGFDKNKELMMQIVNNKDDHATWIETYYRKFKLENKKLSVALRDFNDSLVGGDTIHTTVKEYKRHFFNWMNTQESKGNLAHLKK